MNRIKAEVLIVGAGPAGLSAAVAASRSCMVTVVDDNPRAGGQIWRPDMGTIRSTKAAKYLDELRSGRVEMLTQTQIFAAPERNCLLAETPDGTVELEFEKLIIATGARERFLPFPGWTLPNVFGAGGLQALVKGGVDVKGKRVVVAGTGALLLAVGAYLRDKGADVLLIAEQAPAARVNRFAVGLWRSPAKIAQAALIKKRLLGVPYLTDCWITSVEGDERAESVQLKRKGRNWSVDADIVACGFHLVPNTELAAILGCEINGGFVTVNEIQQTTCENIYCAGEPTGIGGVDASLVEGTIAGLSAAGQTGEARQHFGKRNKAHQFADALNKGFELRDELRSLADDTTIVCRCEDVEYGRLTAFDNSREAKLQTRCGMGPCQGRICGPATEFLFGWKPGSVRPPIFPVKMEDL